MHRALMSPHWGWTALLLQACAASPSPAPSPSAEPPPVFNDAEPAARPWYGELALTPRPELPPAPAAPDALDEDASPPATAGSTPPTASLPPPTPEEFAAWDRRDPEGEAHLNTFDKQHFDELDARWRELACFELAVVGAGNRLLSGDAGDWARLRTPLGLAGDKWIQALLGADPSILTKSRLLTHLLERHELIFAGYPEAYEAGDADALRKLDAHARIVEEKTARYAERIGAEPQVFDPRDPAALSWCAAFLDGL